MIKILAISGSLRSGSLNTALLQAAQSCVPAGYEIEIASTNNIPLYNYDDERIRGLPDTVTTLKNKIVASNALLISTPEYNHGIPGVLKNTLDWLTRPPEDIPVVFGKRKVGLIGASPSRLGTAFSQTAWLPILRHLNTHPYFRNQLFVSSSNTAFNEGGELVDKTIRKLLQDYINGFCEFIVEK